MTDEDFGTKILTLVCQTTAPNIRQKVGAAARELLAKPVATREEVRAYLTKWNNWGATEAMVSSHIAALSHFAAPERPRMMIEGMTVDEIQAAMLKAPMNRNSRDYAGTAHRLANTPAPVVDEDAKAKRLAWAHACASGITNGAKNADGYWDTCSGRDQSGWRAVAKEAGNE